MRQVPVSQILRHGMPSSCCTYSVISTRIESSCICQYLNLINLWMLKSIFSIIDDRCVIIE